MKSSSGPRVWSQANGPRFKLGEHIMGQVFDGRSNTIAPILGAKFWREGVILKGLKVLGDFDTRNGKCVSFHVGKPIMITADQVNPPRDADFATEVVAVGNMKGFEMAVTAS